ncbi:uncharacterized protein FYW23_008921 [Sylvia borin]
MSNLGTGILSAFWGAPRCFSSGPKRYERHLREPLAKRLSGNSRRTQDRGLFKLPQQEFAHKNLKCTRNPRRKRNRTGFPSGRVVVKRKRTKGEPSANRKPHRRFLAAVFWRPRQDSVGCWGGSRADQLHAGTR